MFFLELFVFCFLHLKSFPFVISECFLFSFYCPRFYSDYFNIKHFIKFTRIVHVVFLTVTNIFTTVSKKSKNFEC